MTGDDGNKGRLTMLPDDLLGTVYRCFSLSTDHARFAAVCRSWRAAASWQSKLPALPLLLPRTGNGRLDQKRARAYSAEDGRVLPGPLPWFPYGKRIVGSYDGGWVAAARGCQIDIVNLFTCAWVLRKGHIPCRCHIRPYKFSTKKIVFSEDPSSQGCFLAAISTSCIALCWLGGPGGWTTPGCCMSEASYLVDIAFCNGELYGLSNRGDLLYKLVIGLDDHNYPVIISLQEITIQQPVTSDPCPRYIFDLGGKIATVVMVSPEASSRARTFKVFELVGCDSDTTEAYNGMSAEVTSLGDHALFLGPGCCKAVHMSSATRGKVERNCIYYSDKVGKDRECIGRLDLGSFARRGSCHGDSITLRSVVIILITTVIAVLGFFL